MQNVCSKHVFFIFCLFVFFCFFLNMTRISGNAFLLSSSAAKGFIPRTILNAYNQDSKKSDTTTIVDDSDTDEQHIYAEIIDKSDCLTYSAKSTKEEWPHVYEQTVEPDTHQGLPAPTDEVRLPYQSF